MHDIALIVGSLRKESWSRKVGHAMRELAAPTLRLEEVEIGNLPHYNQDLEGEQAPREWLAFRDRMRGMNGVLFVTPEYNRSVPGVLKNALDIGSRPREKNVWAGKPTAIVSVTTGTLGAFGANHHLRQSLVFLDMPTMQQPEAYFANAASAFDASGQLQTAQREFLTKFVTAYSAWVDRFAQRTS